MEEASNEIKVKAEILVRDGKVKKELETEKRIYFKVSGETEVHSVIFDKKTNSCNCDCRYFALNQKDCSHIIAARLKQKS
jgi:hypothetical protein